MKRAAVLFFLIALPGVVFAEGTTRRMIVATRHPAAEAMQRLRGDDFDPANRIRYNARAFKYVNAFVADLDESEIAALKKSPEVDYIEPDPERHALADAITNGVQTTAYGINLVKAPQAWPITKGRSIDASKPVRVAIIDTGIDYNSPELSANYKGGRDVVNSDDDPLDDAGHGTHVAGIIGAADDGQGVVGVAPQVELYSVKVLDSCGSGSGSGVIQALEWVRDKKRNIGGDWIVNLSLGSNTPSSTERNAFAAAQADGLLVFAASGNDFSGHPTTISFPAGYPSVVSVGSVDASSTVSYFSQRSADLKVVAPGGPSDSSAANAVDSLILSTFIDGQLTMPDGSKTLARFSDAFDTDSDESCLDFPRAGVTAPYVFCGTGRPDQIPASVAGKIALVERGGTDPNNSLGFFFVAKMKYAKAAGAVGVVVYNIPGRPLINPALTDLTPTDISGLIPFAMVSEADGARLKATSGTISLKMDHDNYTSTYDSLQGTSMACPHATGVAALAWSVAPNMKNTEIADAMEKTAKDLGDAGVDNTYGFGLLDAKAAVDMLNTSNPAQGKPTGRPPGRRGH
jgi:serine protease